MWKWLHKFADGAKEFKENMYHKLEKPVFGVAS